MEKTQRNYDELIEELSEIEHKQWIDWSKALWDKLKTIKYAIECGDINTAIFLINDQKHKWNKNWIPYNQLSDEIKEEDRKYARKVIKLLNKNEN